MKNDIGLSRQSLAKIAFWSRIQAHWRSLLWPMPVGEEKIQQQKPYNLKPGSQAGEGLFLPIYKNFTAITSVHTKETTHFLPTSMDSSSDSRWRNIIIKVPELFIIFNVTVDAGVMLDFTLWMCVQQQFSRQEFSLQMGNLIRRLSTNPNAWAEDLLWICFKLADQRQMNTAVVKGRTGNISWAGLPSHPSAKQVERQTQSTQTEEASHQHSAYSSQQREEGQAITTGTGLSFLVEQFLEMNSSHRW